MNSEVPEGAPPAGGWAVFKPELHVTSLSESLDFWVGLLGFTIAYQRKDEGFVYLERSNRAQLMLCQRHGRWETGEMRYPLGQGVMFQLNVESLDPILAALKQAEYPIYHPLREVWRKHGDRLGGQRELFVQDPDGYLIMLEDNLGERPLDTEANL